MHKISLFVVGVLVLCLVGSAAVSQTIKPGRYRARAVIIVHGFGGSFGAPLFCNNQDAIRKFERAVLEEPLHAIAIKVPDQLVVDPILHVYDYINKELRWRFTEVVLLPWDWRRGVEYNVEQYLLPEYQRLAAKYRRVHLVGHSTGGLLIRSLLARVGDANLGRVAFCGVPHEGLAASYLAWNGGMLQGTNIWTENYTRLIFDYIQTGCGCGSQSRLDFFRNGCASYPYPMESLRDLIPSYAFVRKGSVMGQFVTSGELCQKNPFLEALEQVTEPWDVQIRAHYFVSRSQSTPYFVAIKDNDKQCSRLRWPDGSYKSIYYKTAGDNRVVAESGCPDLWSMENPPQCTFTDKVPAIGKHYKPKAINHGNCTTVFTEEIANFLQYGRITKPPTTTTSTTSTTTLAVTTTTEGDPTTTLPVTTTTIPDESLAGVRIEPDWDLGLIYTQRSLYAFADADGGGVLDDDVSMHAYTTWSADDTNIVQFYPDGGQMYYVGFQVGTTTIRVSFDPDGDGPKSPYTDAITVTINDGSGGEG